ncbi:MAG: NAD(P)/FAD-dependent oxidoreductase [Chthonomonadales bacterium]
MQEFDFVIVGSGHNGLTAAAYLAKAGKSVVVLEKRPSLGGACVTEEVWPGYHVSTAAYLCSLLHPAIISDLELHKYGFEIDRRDPSGFAPFEDGSYLLFQRDESATRKELLRVCPKDADAYFQFEKDVETAADILEPFFLDAAPSMGKIADAFSSQGAFPLFEQFFTQSVRTLLENRFNSEKLMAVLSTDGLIGTAAGPSDHGTAYVLLHHYMGRAVGARGAWGYVKGGMGSVSNALAQSAIANGAVILSDKEVARIDVTNDRAAGVTCTDGSVFSGKAVLSNAHPFTTFGLTKQSPPPDIAETINRWKTHGVSCKINMTVSELPNFTAMPGLASGPQHRGTVHLAPNMDFLDKAWHDCHDGRPSEYPMVEIYMQSATDSSLVPEGKHMLSCFTQYFPYEIDSNLNAIAEENRYYRRVIDTIARFAPNVPESIENVQVLTPRKLEEQFGLIGGHIFHGDITPNQMFGGRFGLADSRTPIRGLYICGSGAWPGGCVSGIPGSNAARQVLKDLQNKKI